MTTIKIKYRHIPSYLHGGHFYRSLDSDDPEGIIEVPADCFYQDGERVANVIKFNQLLRVMAFWMLDEIPVGILHFCNTHNIEEWEQSIVDLPGALKQTVQPLLLSVFAKSEYVLLNEIVKIDRWELIIYAVSRIGNQASATEAAAQCGHLRLLQHLHENEFVWHKETCAAASREGHLDCLQYARENGCPWDVEVFKGAAQNGHMPCMEYAHRQGLREWNASVCKEAALGGHLDCLQFAHENGCPWDTDVFYGHLNCMQYAHQQGMEWNAGVCVEAAKNEKLDCLRYAHENGCPWDSSITQCTAKEGHVHCLQYALEHACPADEKACSAACMGGHLECLQLLHQSGVPCNEYTAYCAARNPSIDCLQYLYEHSCPWDEYTPSLAAHEGEIEPLRYALEHGCPHFADIVQNTAHGNSLDCLQYIVENQGLHMDEKVFKLALLRGDLAYLQYLLDQGCPFLGAVFNDYAENLYEYESVFRYHNPEFILCAQYAVERGWVPCSTFIGCATRDQPCSDWLFEEGFYATLDSSRE